MFPAKRSLRDLITRSGEFSACRKKNCSNGKREKRSTEHESGDRRSSSMKQSVKVAIIGYLGAVAVIALACLMLALAVRY
jgi:hypothetical protein